jgi:hypothetical protein
MPTTLYAWASNARMSTPQCAAVQKVNAHPWPAQPVGNINMTLIAFCAMTLFAKTLTILVAVLRRACATP